MNRLKISIYPDTVSGPVADYLISLAYSRPSARAKLDTDLGVLGLEGLRSSRITVRPRGDGLWELKRLYEGIQYRIFFCVRDGAVWLLHAFEKKSGKTPAGDLLLARKRMKAVA